MNHSDHVHLIQKAIRNKGGVWADLGSGDGAFTLALRDLAGKDATIYSIDKDQHRLETQQKQFKKLFPKTSIIYIQQDFTIDLHLPMLDGILMANSLHYIEEKDQFIENIKNFLKPNGKLLIVEYNIDDGNTWVPHPLSYSSFASYISKMGFSDVELLEKIPSSYWDEMYAAQAILIDTQF